MTTSYVPYQQGMLALVQSVRAIDISTFESGSRELVSTELAPRTTTLVAQANRLVQSVLEASEPANDANAGEPTIEGFSDVEPETMVRSTAIADTAFMANFELRERASRLARLGVDENRVWVAECDRALRKVKKALCALDRTISKVAATPAHLDLVSERALSLRVRQCYAVFRRKSLAGQADCSTPDELEAALRRTGYQLSVIMGSAVYPVLRMDDRALLRALQQRILAWVKSQERDNLEARVIWQDSCALFEILGHVSRRQELVEHDARVIHGVLDELAAHEVLSEASRTNLASLEGLDDEVDGLLAEGTRSPSRWQSVLTRVVARFRYGRPSLLP